jgi:hypothetical protein
MKGLVATDVWTPAAGSADFVAKQVALKQSAVVINAGNMWSEVLPELKKKGHVAVHGADSVSQSHIFGPWYLRMIMVANTYVDSPLEHLVVGLKEVAMDRIATNTDSVATMSSNSKLFCPLGKL